MGAALIILTLMVFALLPGKPATPVIVVVGILGFVFALWSYWGTSSDDFFNIEEDDAHLGVDVWKVQRTMMVASDQRLPVAPCLHNGSILYAALIAEETGETYEGIFKILEAYAKVFPEHLGVTRLMAHFRQLADGNTHNALEIRAVLKSITLDLPLSEEEAVELFDGTTDIAVVNAGFALASGLPGSDGYVEVARSNLSKRNPDTGKIDKTADGKWIKGVNYQNPDLARVLKLHGAALWVNQQIAGVEAEAKL